MFNNKQRGTQRNTSFSVRYNKGDNMWHISKATQYVGPSSDGVNRVFNSARTVTVGGNETKFSSATQMLTNVQSDAQSLFGKGIISKWQ